MYCQGWSHSKALVLSLGCVLKSPGSFQNYHLLDPAIESYSLVWVGGIFSRLPRYAHVQSLAMLFLITFTWEQASQPPWPTVLPHSVSSWVGMGSDAPSWSCSGTASALHFLWKGLARGSWDGSIPVRNSVSSAELPFHWLGRSPLAGSVRKVMWTISHFFVKLGVSAVRYHSLPIVFSPTLHKSSRPFRKMSLVSRAYK